jgi:hypothetical protein
MTSGCGHRMSLGALLKKLRSVKSTSRSSKSAFLQEVGQATQLRFCPNCRRCIPQLISPRFDQWQLQKDRVAPGRHRPGAPTDPYVRALAHTVPLIMDSLRA